MEPVVVAVLIGIAVYILVVAMIPSHILAESTTYTRTMLEQLERESLRTDDDDQVSVLRQQIQKANLITRVFFTLPLAKRAYPSLLKAGLSQSIEQFFIFFLILFLMLVYLMRSWSLTGLVLAVALTYFIAWAYIRRRIKKRNALFLNLFPEALDMIVRSVRSGYPLNAAVRMVSENMQPPVSNEFKQVSDEVSFGSTLIDALTRLSYRLDEPDVRFFVVMLTVQQEVGGNLSEVLSNLAGIIRKRRHLRMKIKALTSEGRATAWVLGSLPLAVAAAIYYVAPLHFVPLIETTLGNMVLAGAIGIYLLGAFIVWQMVNMEI